MAQDASSQSASTPHPPQDGATGDPARKQKKAKTVTITLPGGNTREVIHGTPASQLLQEVGVETPYTPVAVRFCNKVTSYTRPLDKDGPLEPIHIATRDGALIYRRSLSFVLIRAAAELFPDLRVYINHSLDRGYYVEFYNEEMAGDEAVGINEEDVRRIEARMREIVEADEPITRENVPKDKAVELFRERDMNDKAEVLEYGTNRSVSLYRLGGEVNHFYGQLAPSTGMLKAFELAYEAPGLILRFPSESNPETVPPSEPHEKMRDILREYERWMRILDWRRVAQLNNQVENGKVREYVLISEALHEKRLAQIADAITHHDRRVRIVLLSGPSSSGKTTTVKRLAIQLRVNGKKALVIGLDDFFVDREKTPRDESGEFDFESFYAIDIDRLQKTVRALLRGEQVQLPRFNFIEGRSEPGETVRLESDQLLVLEGIHALNHDLLPTVPDGLTFRIYASPLTHLNIDDHNRISSSDVRLLRRLVRDYSYRGHDAVDTIRRWPSVRRGEQTNIFPYQENADVIFNSSLPYEIAALKEFALPVLKRVSQEEVEFGEAARLIKFLSYFREIEADLVPRHSLLREFIGGSCFTY